MGRAAIAVVWMMIAGSANAAFMKGTLTLDDGQTATLTVGRFVLTSGNPIYGARQAVFQCTGDACFGPTGTVGFRTPRQAGYHLNFDTSSDSPSCFCRSSITFGIHPVQCGNVSRVECTEVLPGPISNIVAKGMLVVHRPTPRCRRAVRRAAQ